MSTSLGACDEALLHIGRITFETMTELSHRRDHVDENRQKPSLQRCIADTSFTVAKLQFRETVRIRIERIQIGEDDVALNHAGLMNLPPVHPGIKRVDQLLDL